MIGDYMSMAEAVGDVPPRPMDFTPTDEDLQDPDWAEITAEAMDRQSMDEVTRLRKENHLLRLQLSRYEDQ